MKLSLSKLMLSVAALLCLEPTSAQAQGKRSFTDAPVMSQWLAEDALTFAQTIYDTYSLLQAPEADRLAPLASGCGWTSYPSDYGCYTYDFGYRSPADYSPLAGHPQPSNFVAASPVDESTDLCGIPCDAYPCMIEAETAVEPWAISTWIMDASASAQELGAQGLEQCEAILTIAANVAEQGVNWLVQQRDLTVAESSRLVIRPLEDIDASFADDEIQVVLAVEDSSEFIDYEWQVALEYFAEYGCPEFAWDEAADSAAVTADEVGTSGLKLWVAQTASQAVGQLITRSHWYNATIDALATIQSQHDELLAATARVPAIPAEEFMLDYETYVNINNQSPESIPSLARALMTAVRSTWTGSLSTAAADRIMR